MTKKTREAANLSAADARVTRVVKLGTPQAVIIEQASAILTQLDRVRANVEARRNEAETTFFINWAHVGDIRHVRDLLDEITTFLRA